MKQKKSENNYWEIEDGETIEFGTSFMRCYDKAGKLQFGVKYFDVKTGEKKYLVKFVLDRNELFGSHEGADYLKQTLEDWDEIYYGENDN